MSRLRALKAQALIPLAIWIFSQIVATGLLGFGPVHAGGLAGLPQAGDVVVICTPDGFQKILVPNEEAQEAPHYGGAGCEWCRGFDLSGDVTGTEPSPQIVAAPREIGLCVSTSVEFAQAFHWPPYLTRAPPL